MVYKKKMYKFDVKCTRFCIITVKPEYRESILLQVTLQFNNKIK